MSGDRDEPFLARWARLKHEAAEAEAALVAEPAPAEPPGPSDERVEDAPEAGAPSPELPDPETLDAASDVTAYLKRGISDALRNAALRRAWTLDPAIRDFVEVADYQYDWNTPGGAPGYAELVTDEADRRALLDHALGRHHRPAPEQTEAPIAEMTRPDLPDGTEAAEEPASASGVQPARADADGENDPGTAGGDEATNEPAAPSEDILPQADLSPASSVGSASPPPIGASAKPVATRRHGGALPRV